MTQTFTAVIDKEEDWYGADGPEVGTASQGKTIEEAIANLKEATELYLEEFPLPQTCHPFLTTFDVATYAYLAASLRPRSHPRINWALLKCASVAAIF